MIILSSREARQILAGAQSVSLDLGMTASAITAGKESVAFPDGQNVGLEYVKRIAEDSSNLYLIDDGKVMKAMFFSEATKKFYKLRPTATWPALEISGILMHRIKDIEPKTAAERMVAALSPVSGSVLDTCCGLGYTAIIAARTARSVTVFENDASVLELCRVNPYSQELFTNKKIVLKQGDVIEEIAKFPDEALDAIIHDPPSISIAGDLYSDKFYAQLFRALKSDGRILHYTGAPGHMRGADLPSSVAKRLEKAGFVTVSKDEKTLSVIAKKP
jgi:predicted methyltransferase